jgi:hypothetical protein
MATDGFTTTHRVSDVLAAQIEKAEQMRGLYMSEQKKAHSSKWAKW